MRETPVQQKIRHGSPLGKQRARKAMVRYHAVTLLELKHAGSRRSKRVLARSRRPAQRKINPLTHAAMTQLLNTYAPP